MAGAQVQISPYFISELPQIEKPCKAWVKQTGLLQLLLLFSELSSLLT